MSFDLREARSCLLFRYVESDDATRASSIQKRDRGYEDQQVISLTMLGTRFAIAPGVGELLVSVCI